MDKLTEYIKSTFNYATNIDAKQKSKNSQLSLWNRPYCRVYITPLYFDEIIYDKEKYYELIYSVLEELNLLMKGKIEFSVVNSPNLADLKIYWRKGTKKAIGMQYYEEKNIAGITIGIASFNDELYDIEEVYSITLHEFGHILGLGHSPDRGDLMHNYVNNIQNFSQNDRFVIDLIYSIGSGKTYEECRNFIEEKVREYKKIERPAYENRNITDETYKLAENKKRNLFQQNIKVNYPKYILY